MALAPDTISPNAHEAQGYNVYAYVANNPTTWVDPSGNQIAPPFDSGPFIDALRQTSDMMRSALENFRISTFGAQMIALGAQMGQLVALAGGITSFNIGVGLLVTATLFALSAVIWMCLINQNSPCFQSSTMQSLREMASEGIQTLACQDAAVDEATLAGVMNYDPKFGIKYAKAMHNPCVPQPEKEKEKSGQCDSSAFVAWWNTLAPAKSGYVTDKWWQYEQLAARGGMAYGFTPRRVPTGPIDADGIEPRQCAFVDAKYAENADKEKYEVGQYAAPGAARRLHNELSRYHNAVIVSNGTSNAQPRGLIIRTNSLSSLPHYQSAMISAGFSLKDSRVEWMPFE